MDKKKARREEINYLFELLQACLQEEGYQIGNRYGDFKYKSFEIPLRNSALTDGENVTIEIKFENWG